MLFRLKKKKAKQIENENKKDYLVTSFLNFKLIFLKIVKNYKIVFKKDRTLS